MLRRFSTAWWISLGSASCAFGLLTYLVLRSLGVADDDRLVLYMLVSIGLGDVLVALSLEMTAPTRITVGPGDRRVATSALRDAAEVVSGFQGSMEGFVRVRGETWKARTEDERPAVLAAGTGLKVVDREGLVLIVAAPEEGQARREETLGRA